jgi:CRISPR system Cascade subunit CasD
MRQILLFQLYGHLASWGKPALGEIRPSYSHPTKTAILGIIAAALGLEREDENAHLALHEDLKMAVQVYDLGVPMVDLHTIQSSTAKRGALKTRREEILSSSKHTILSEREYFQEACYLVGLWTTSSRFSLEEIEVALRHPTFTLYLGRKGCPLCLPLNPKILYAKKLSDAFSQFEIPLPLRRLAKIQNKAELNVQIYWEGEKDEFSLHRTHERVDGLVSRKRWLFKERIEHQSVMNIKIQD